MPSSFNVLCAVKRNYGERAQFLDYQPMVGEIAVFLVVVKAKTKKSDQETRMGPISTAESTNLAMANHKPHIESPSLNFKGLDTGLLNQRDTFGKEWISRNDVKDVRRKE